MDEALKDEVRRLVDRPEFPRARRYDVEWVVDTQMGPNPLWLLEWLCEELPLAPGERVLDLGCGRGATSVFLAREFDARVWAADLWIGPDGTWRRAREAGVEDNVCPQRAEAHALPFAKDFFDAAISIDAYQYFGTDDLYLDYLAGFVRPGGRIGIVVPALTQPFPGDEVPPHLGAPQSNGHTFWEPSCRCFHTVDWWRAHWSRSPAVRDVSADVLEDGWRHWRDFEIALERTGKSPFPSVAEALETDAGRYLGFVRVIATRAEGATEDLYDPTIGVRFGVEV